MFFRKSKLFIYIFLLSIFLHFIIPFASFALDKDSVYVWSNSSSSVPTSILPTNNEESTDTTLQDGSR